MEKWYGIDCISVWIVALLHWHCCFKRVLSFPWIVWTRPKFKYTLMLVFHHFWDENFTMAKMVSNALWPNICSFFWEYIKENHIESLLDCHSSIKKYRNLISTEPYTQFQNFCLLFRYILRMSVTNPSFPLNVRKPTSLSTRIQSYAENCYNEITLLRARVKPTVTCI